MATTPSSGRWWLAIVPFAVILVLIIAVVIATRAPAPPTASPSAAAAVASATGSVAAAESVTPTPSGGVTTVGGGGGGGNGGANAGGGAGGNGAGGSASPVATEEPTASPSATPLADLVGGPFEVKQIQTLGGEKISGFACSPSRPFSVAASTDKVAWTIVFVPTTAARGSVSYAYSIPSAGETHSATGTYTMSGPAPDGIRHVSFTVSDHVVFHGFDGNIPVRYKFDLVPASVPACPG